MKNRTAENVNNCSRKRTAKTADEKFKERLKELVQECKEAGLGAIIRLGTIAVEKQRKEQDAEKTLEAWEQKQREEIYRRQNLTREILVRVDAFTWGQLNAAALINDCSVEEVLQAFVCYGDRINEWWTDGCPVDSRIEVPE